MPIETIQHEGQHYPAYQATGNAARFIRPFAEEVCKGFGFDIGCNRPQWAILPNAILVDPALDGCIYDAHNLPNVTVDYCFSSHMLEHVNDWVGALDHWYTRLRSGGVLFLYLPHYKQSYWRPWSNRKHVNILTPEMLKDYLQAKGYTKIFVTGCDLNHSFAVIAEKI